MSNPKLWTRNFVTVSAINFFLILVFYLLVVIIGIYATEHFQASLSAAGLVVGVFIIGTLIGRLFIGQLIETIGRRRTLLCGLILSIATTALYYVDYSNGFLIFTRFLHGVALGVASTATGTVVAQLIPNARKAEGIGYYSMSTTLATAIGPFIGLFLIHHTSFEVIFGVCVILSTTAFVAGLFLQVPELPSGQATASRKFSVANLLERKAVPIATVTLLIAFYYSGVLSFINAYAIELDLVQAASIFFVVYSVAVLLSRPFTGRLLDAKGANIVMYPGFVLLGAGLLMLGTAQSTVTMLMAGALIGLGFGNMQSCTQAIAIKMVEPHRMGLATSTFFIFLDAGLGFGPYLLGQVIPYTGYGNLYLLMGVLTLATIGVYYFLHGRKERVWRENSQLNPAS